MAGMTATLPLTARAVTLPDPEKKATLNLSCQEGVAPGRSLTEKLDFLEENGFVGLEPGGGDLANRVEEFKKALSGRKIKISAICAGFKGLKLIGYQDFVSLECGSKGDRKKTIPAAAKLIREQWEMA